MRKTKIVATIGPACSNENVFRDMCLAGLNVARLNFSHGTYEEHLEKIAMIKSVRKDLGLPVAILLDTKGPEYRIKTFENGSIHCYEPFYQQIGLIHLYFCLYHKLKYVALC